MDLTPTQISEIESRLAELEALEGAELPEPAAELVTLLESILEDEEGS